MKKKGLLVLSALILGVATICVTAFAKEHCKHCKKVVQLPDSINAVVKKMCPSADIKKVEMKNMHIKAYDIDLKEQDKETSLLICEDGTVISFESEIPFENLPKNVAATVSDNVKNAKIVEAEKKEKYAVVKLVKLPETQILYETKVVKDGKEYEILVDGNGNLVNIKADEAKGYDEDDDDDKGEEFISFSQLPEAVKDALKVAAGDGPIEEIQQEKDDGQMTYEAKIIIDNKKYEIKIDSNGKILEKKNKDDKEDDDND